VVRRDRGGRRHPRRDGDVAARAGPQAAPGGAESRAAKGLRGMDCEQMEMRIGAWLDGELDAAEEREVAAHVDGCARCAAELESLRRLRASIREQMPPLRASDTLRARLRAAVRATAAAAAAPPST